MAKEDKKLLLKDLSARLSYGVKISIPELWTSENKIEILDEIFKGDDGLYRVNGNGMLIENIKPYLRSMSSMTEEEIREFTRFASIWVEREQHLPENPFESQDLQMVKIIETRMNHFGELWVRYMWQGRSLEASAYHFGKMYKLMEE